MQQKEKKKKKNNMTNKTYCRAHREKRQTTKRQNGTNPKDLKNAYTEISHHIRAIYTQKKKKKENNIKNAKFSQFVQEITGKSNQMKYQLASLIIHEPRDRPWNRLTQSLGTAGMRGEFA